MNHTNHIITHSAGLFINGEQFEPQWVSVTGVTPTTYTLTIKRQVTINKKRGKKNVKTSKNRRPRRR